MFTQFLKKLWEAVTGAPEAPVQFDIDDDSASSDDDLPFSADFLSTNRKRKRDNDPTETAAETVASKAKKQLTALNNRPIDVFNRDARVISTHAQARVTSTHAQAPVISTYAQALSKVSMQRVVVLGATLS